MAITSSAKKAIRSSARKRVFNLRSNKKIDDVLKKIKRFIETGKIGEVKALLPIAYKAIDKATKKKFLKKNTASRMKSRLTKFVNKRSK
jgi:small subunit ribosomal protein S20